MGVASTKRCNVLVTGFDRFLDNDVNPSWLIAQSLPSLLHELEIHVPARPIEVSYRAVQEMVPRLLATRSFDIVLNLGLAPSRADYSIETCARRDGYEREDVRREKMPASNPTDPEIMYPDLDIDQLCASCAAQSPSIRLRRSADAGRYLCEYLYFAVMMHYWHHQKAARCVFLHVPCGIYADDISRGREVVLSVLRAMVAQDK